MPVDFGSLTKIEGLPALHRSVSGNPVTRLLVLVKLRKGCAFPDYIERRGEPAPGFFSAVVAGDELPMLEADPAVMSISISKALPAVD